MKKAKNQKLLLQAKKLKINNYKPEKIKPCQL